MSKINKIKLSGTTYDVEDANASKTVELTQAQYDALVSSGAVDSNTFYIITDASTFDPSTKVDTSAFTSYSASVETALSGKQDTLVSGTNIKTINNESILGSGNIDIQGGSTYTAGRGIDITNDTISLILPISAGTGSNSIIEGINTTASGSYSHAEGYNSKAQAEASHAEGYSTAKESYCHSEGYATIAHGFRSHAEGAESVASGDTSHAEGKDTRTSNHAEHASGRFNVSSSASTTFGDSGNTLFSVGNGTANNARHNAFEIRQNGDIYLTLNGQDVKLQDQLGGSSITVDTALDSGSTNPVENRVIYNKIDEVEQVTAAALNNINDRLSEDEEVTAAGLNALNESLNGKQATLVSGTNIKTINNQSILGSGNIDIQGGSSYTAGDGIDITNDVISVTGKVDTSAITTSITSSSTDAQIPSAKAVNDKFGGLKLQQITQSDYNNLQTKDPSTLYIIVN